MTNENLEKLKSFYKDNDYKVNGMKLKKWLELNKEISNKIDEEFNKHQNLNTKANIIHCLVHNVDLNLFKCKTCGKDLKVIHITHVPKFCSTKCAALDPELQNRKKETISQDPNYYQKRFEKTKKTNLERYGTKTPAESDIVKQHMKDTFSKDPNIWKKRQEKSIKTCLEKYGVENAYNIEKIKNKSIITKRKKLYNSFDQYKISWKPLFSEDEFLQSNIKVDSLKYHCMKCNNDFEFCFGNEKILINTNRPKNIPSCPNCSKLPHGVSINEDNILKYIKSIYSGKILNSTKEFTNPYELDIVIPDKKIAIEYNGNYWHSLKVRNDIFYHLNKTKICEENNLRLIHIFEFRWNDLIKKEIIKNRIKDALEIYDNIDFNNIDIIRNYDKDKIYEFLKNHSLNSDIEFDESISLIENGNIISNICFKDNFIINYSYIKVLKNDLKILLSNIHNVAVILDYSFDNIKKFKDEGFTFKELTKPNLIFDHNDNYKIYDCGNLVFEKRY